MLKSWKVFHGKKIFSNLISNHKRGSQILDPEKYWMTTIIFKSKFQNWKFCQKRQKFVMLTFRKNFNTCRNYVVTYYQTLEKVPLLLRLEKLKKMTNILNNLKKKLPVLSKKCFNFWLYKVENDTKANKNFPVNFLLNPKGWLPVAKNFNNDKIYK